MVDNILQIFEAVAFKKLDAEKEIDNWQLKSNILQDKRHWPENVQIESLWRNLHDFNTFKQTKLQKAWERRIQNYK